MTAKVRRLGWLLAILAIALVAAACGGSDEESGGTTDAVPVDTGGESTGASTGAVENEKVKKIAFFGFWKSNSFTQALKAGVEEAATAAGAEVVDLSPAAYDGPAQIKAMQDQTTKGDAEVYIVLANDPVGVATAAEQAIAKGITVVAAFTPIGGKFDTLEPQVEGSYFVGESPVANGEVLGELAASACEGQNPCNVAYLQGLKSLPLDNARTDAFKAALKENAPDAKLVAEPEGGYTPQTGQKAAQDVMQAHSDLNVMVGSSQAMLGAQKVVDTAKVKLVGNGSSNEAFESVNNGKWYALYYMDVAGTGKKAAETGIGAANGQDVEPSFDTQTLHDPHGTKDVIADVEPTYSDLS